MTAQVCRLSMHASMQAALTEQSAHRAKGSYGPLQWETQKLL